MKRGFFLFILDGLVLVISFFFFIYLKYNNLQVILTAERTTIYFLVLWLLISAVTGKFNKQNLRSFNENLLTTAFSNLVILGFSLILIRISKPFVDFRFIILYSIFLATGLELVLGYLYILIYKAMKAPFVPERFNGAEGTGSVVENIPVDQQTQASVKEIEPLVEFESLVDLNAIIIEETDQATFDFIRNYFSPKKIETLIISTTTVFNLYNQPRTKYQAIINLKRINDIQYINKFFEAVNSKLNNGGIFIDWVETYSQRKNRILNKYPWGINYLVYTFDFFFKRIIPKLNLTKKIYFLFTKGNNRVLSKAETFGRLYSCGFEIVEEQFINNRLFFVTRKVKEPLFDYHPTYGPIVKLKRIGKNGQIIGVFKLRTMHAYSEYLQDYIYNKFNLDEGGKFRNDFRVSTLGKILRALWIDELPMLINVFIVRNMKIVGVRPLSPHYFSLYSEELKKKRINWKPGLIPPYFAQNPTPKTLDEIQENEMKYLLEYEKSAVITDIKYFFKAFYNIIFHKARSK